MKLTTKNEFKSLVKRHPFSGYRGAAYIEIGEYYLRHENIYGALRGFLKASGIEMDAEYTGFTMYRLAWCFLLVGENEKAIATMKIAVELESPVQEAAKTDLAKMTAIPTDQK